MVSTSGLSRALTFGKYKGELARFILQRDPEYLYWAAYNVKFFGATLNEDDYKKINDAYCDSRFGRDDDNSDYADDEARYMYPEY